MSKTTLDEAVNRFLFWKLPTDFAPDCGITFKAEYNEGTHYPARHEPVGTNLLTAIQAREMLEHVIGEEPERLRKTLTVARQIGNAAILENVTLRQGLTQLRAENDRLRQNVSDCEDLMREKYAEVGIMQDKAHAAWALVKELKAELAALKEKLK